MSASSAYETESKEKINDVCPSGHKLREISVEELGRSDKRYERCGKCVICSRRINPDETFRHCDTCCYDLCRSCWKVPIRRCTQKCRKGHCLRQVKVDQLAKETFAYEDGATCGKCKRKIAQTEAIRHCDLCGYDLCFFCWDKEPSMLNETELKVVSISGKTITFKWKIPEYYPLNGKEWIGLYIHNEPQQSKYIRDVKVEKKNEVEGTFEVPYFGTYDLRFSFQTSDSLAKRHPWLFGLTIAGSFLLIGGLIVVGPLLAYNAFKNYYQDGICSEPFTVGPEVVVHACYKGDSDNKVIVTWDRSKQSQTPKTDWVALYKVSERDNGQYIKSGWNYTSAAEGNEGLEFDLPQKHGMYEFRYYFQQKGNYGYAYSGCSNPIGYPKDDGFDDIVFGASEGRAMRDYEEKNGVLSFKKGDAIRICRVNSNGLWFGECAGTSGWFPSQFIKLTSDVSPLKEGPEQESEPVEVPELTEKEEAKLKEVLNTPKVSTVDWGKISVTLDSGDKVSLQPFVRYRKPDKEEFLVFFNTEFQALLDALKPFSSSGIIRTIRNELERHISEYGKEIRSDAKIAAFVINKRFDCAGKIHIAPGRWYQNVERALSILVKKKNVFMAVKGLEQHLDNFECMIKPDASLEDTIEYCFILHQVNHYLKLFEPRLTEHRDYATVKAIVDLRKKLNYLMLMHCFPDDEGYSPMNDVPVNHCRLALDDSYSHKMYLGLVELNQYISNARTKAVAMAKNIKGEVSPDDLTDKSLAKIVSSLDSDLSLEQKKAKLQDRIDEEVAKRDEAFVEATRGFAKLAEKVIEIIVKFSPALSILKSFKTEGLSGNILQKLGGGLKKCFGSSNDTQKTPLATELLSNGFVNTVIDQVFDSLKHFMKGYRSSQTILLLEATMAKLEGNEKYVDSFVDLLRFYFALMSHHPQSGFTRGVIVSWNDVSEKGVIERSDFMITDVSLPEENEN